MIVWMVSIGYRVVLLGIVLLVCVELNEGIKRRNVEVENEASLKCNSVRYSWVGVERGFVRCRRGELGVVRSS